jgi:CheY-like chemotaxis protein
VILALDEMDSVARCISDIMTSSRTGLGAVDYLAKPFDPVLLRWPSYSPSIKMRQL